MEVLLPIGLAVIAVLAAVACALAWDTRGDRRAVRAALNALGGRVTGHDNALAAHAGRLGAHDRALAQLDRAVGDLRAAPAPAADDAGEPAPALTRTAPPMSESREAIRARVEAAEDARDRERAQKATVEDAGGVRRTLLPEARADEDRETDEELTHVFTAKPSEADARIPGVPVKRRPTLLGGLAAAPVERPVSAPQRTAEAFRKKHATPTLISAGVEPSVPTVRTGTPVPPAPRDAVEARYRALCDDARGKGLAADHCCNGNCWGDTEGMFCSCQCDGCVRATAYAAQAEHEIMGPSGDDPDPRKRGG